jgi:hypothetical protein
LTARAVLKRTAGFIFTPWAAAVSKETMTLLGSGAVKYTPSFGPLNGHATTNSAYAKLTLTAAKVAASDLSQSESRYG